MKRSVLILVAATGLVSCGILGLDEGRACTLVGCMSGLTVHLAARPSGAYRVEVFASFPGQQPAYVYDCSAAGDCAQDIFFRDLIVDHPFIRVITTTGTRRKSRASSTPSTTRMELGADRLAGMRR